MAAVKDRLAKVDGQIETACAAVESDAGASPVLSAVVRELRVKSRKALTAVDGVDDAGVEVKVAVAEVEQAADSAKAAAEADTGASEEARQAVLDAHQSICVLKAKLSS